MPKGRKAPLKIFQVRQRGFISLRCLTSLTSLSLGSDCTNDTLAVVRLKSYRRAFAAFTFRLAKTAASCGIWTSAVLAQSPSKVLERTYT